MLLLELVGGFVLLLAGGEALVRGSVSVARRLGVAPLVIGLTLVGFGTSTPELVTSIEAALKGSPGIAVGNIVGSNIANVLLILGAAALIRPIACDPRAFYRDGTVLAAATLVCVPIALLGGLGRFGGLVLVGLLIAYIAGTYFAERTGGSASADLHTREADPAEPAHFSLPVGLVVALGGLGLIVFGAQLLVGGAVTVARDFGVSETIVGLTLVAVGTSLPELMTSVVASLRGQSDVALGNVIGSNIYNILGILGGTAVVTPLAFPPEIAALDLWVMVAATALVITFAITGWRVGRREGAVLLLAYGGYVAWLATGA